MRRLAPGSGNGSPHNRSSSRKRSRVYKKMVRIKVEQMEQVKQRKQVEQADRVEQVERGEGDIRPSHTGVRSKAKGMVWEKKEGGRNLKQHQAVASWACTPLF